MERTSVILFLVLCFVIYTSCFGNTKRSQRNVFESVRPEDVMDVSDFSIYYEISSNKMITKMMPRPWYKPGWLLRLPFNGGPCNCNQLQCLCCTGIRVQSLNFDRQTCAILNYDANNSFIDMEVKMNNDSIYNNSFSARNPPPFCIPIVVPYLPPGLFDFCVRLFDIGVVDQKLHVCLDMDTRIDKAPVLILHFDCMDMGFSGIGLSKPGGNGTSESTANTDTQEIQAAVDIYDPVTEDDSPATPVVQFLVNNDTINVYRN